MTLPRAVLEAGIKAQQDATGRKFVLDCPGVTYNEWATERVFRAMLRALATMDHANQETPLHRVAWALWHHRHESFHDFQVRLATIVLALAEDEH